MLLNSLNILFQEKLLGPTEKLLFQFTSFFGVCLFAYCCRRLAYVFFSNTPRPWRHQFTNSRAVFEVKVSVRVKFRVVLKISLLHSVFVITNFVIPKRDKKTNKKYITLFRLQPARDPWSPTILYDRGGPPCFASPNLPLCKGTIIVLKLLLLHSVFVITNLVIPKRDKKKQKKRTKRYITPFRLQPAHDPHGDRGGPSCFAPL